jgi:4-amino-4-deoxy-L-arabinose transferase-like glycosyltransferase
MLRKLPRLLWVAVPVAYLLYFYNIGAVGLVGPDEPRYASIGREMAHSGDWITPTLWGAPWFEKPALLYWMIGGAFRLGFSTDLAPRFPVALLSVAFLAFYWWTVRREFGERAGWIATFILATSGMWMGFSQAAATDLPLTATFAAFMLLLLPWFARGERRFLPAAAALLGAATLAKGLTPLVLAAPAALAFWWAVRVSDKQKPGLRDVLRPQVIGAFALVALPWYIACYARNGQPFITEFFFRHHFERFMSSSLQHVQPWWFYIPVLLASMLPWTPLTALLTRLRDFKDPRVFFLAAWAVFGLVFFSASLNKLPGYVLPLMPAIALLTALSLERARNAGAWLAACAALLIVFPIGAAIIPKALGSGTSKAIWAAAPSFSVLWLVPLALAFAVLLLERSGRRVAAVVVIAAGVAAGTGYLKYSARDEVNRVASAKGLWKQISGRAASVCVEGLNRSWTYGLNYYSVEPLPECSATPRPIRIVQESGQQPRIVERGK